MIYLTINNFYKVITKLYLDIPYYVEKSFYENYKLNLLELDLKYFTNDEARILVICDKLFCNVKNTMENLMVSNKEREQEKWVYNLSTPSYHYDKKCHYLNSNFINYKVPQSLIGTDLAEDYRVFFKENIDKYGNSENKIAPERFASILINKFNLSESKDEILNEYILKVELKNSQVSNIQEPEQDIETLFKNIDKKMKEISSNISYKDSRRAFFLKKENESFKVYYEKRKKIVFYLFKIYFYLLNKKGFHFNEKLLEMCGLTPCKACSKNRGE